MVLNETYSRCFFNYYIIEEKILAILKAKHGFYTHIYLYAVVNVKITKIIYI